MVFLWFLVIYCVFLWFNIIGAKIGENCIFVLYFSKLYFPKVYFSKVYGTLNSKFTIQGKGKGEETDRGERLTWEKNWQWYFWRSTRKQGRHSCPSQPEKSIQLERWIYSVWHLAASLIKFTSGVHQYIALLYITSSISNWRCMQRRTELAFPSLHALNCTYHLELLINRVWLLVLLLGVTTSVSASVWKFVSGVKCSWLNATTWKFHCFRCTFKVSLGVFTMFWM